MSQRRRFFGLALGAALFGLPVASPANTPAGPEFRVNGYTTNYQATRSVAVTPQGGFLVTWGGLGLADGSGGGVFGRRYDPAGVPIGGEFLVNGYTTGNQFAPVAAATAAGEFVVAWGSYPQDGAGSGIFARRLDAGGVPIGADFRVNTYTTGNQEDPAIGVEPSGRFVVAWRGPDGSGRGVFAQAFDAAGNPVGVEQRANMDVANDQEQPAVAMDPAGEYVVTWSLGSPNKGIRGRRFDAGGQPLGAQFDVNSPLPATFFENPAVAKDANGDFVVAWQRDVLQLPHPPHLPDHYYTHAQRFDAAGTPIGAEYQVPSLDNAVSPDVAIDGRGVAIVVWHTWNIFQPSPQGAFGQRLDASGRPVGAEFQIDSLPGMEATSPVIDVDASGRFVVAWNDHSPPNSLPDVYARRFDRMVPTALAVDSAAGPVSDGNGVFEAGESVLVEPAWTNFGTGPAAFAGATSAFVGPGTQGNPVYAIVDGSADYGPIAAGGSGSCRDAAPDCHELAVSVPNVRPAAHWDASFVETLEPTAEYGATLRWTLHVGETFSDVPRTNPFYRFVETLLHRGVTGGCGGASYCPSVPTTREQMAVFVLVGRDGIDYAPPACAPPNMFDDVPETSPYCRWIEELARRGVVSGCGGGLYCPTEAVTREQMAVFVLRTLDPTLVPPDCAPPNLFSDVPETSPFCRWIEELARRGVVTGCGGGLYCPAGPVTRAQMAVFIGVTFGLTLYGP